MAFFSLSLGVQAREYQLTQAEKEVAASLFKRLEVKNNVWKSLVCSVKKVRITSKTMGHQPSKWTVKANGKVNSMTAQEIEFALNLFQRLNVPIKNVGFSAKASVVLESVECGFVMPSPGDVETTHWKVYL
jgi:hypothetical protein